MFWTESDDDLARAASLRTAICCTACLRCGARELGAHSSFSSCRSKTAEFATQGQASAKSRSVRMALIVASVVPSKASRQLMRLLFACELTEARG